MNPILPVAALVAFLTSASASAAPLAAVEIHDRTRDERLEVHWRDGRRYVIGEPGHEYEVRIRNHSGGRVLAVTSVDGVNVVTGETASPSQGGYVLEPRGTVDIDGWRKSLEHVAAFVFTSLPDSYAARTGRPDDVGVIGVALFRERTGRRESKLSPEAADSAARASAPPAAEAAQELGTGHGELRGSEARYTRFQRASSTPAEVISIYYDSRPNLVARGIVPGPRFAQQPDPFPGRFVADPP